MPFGAFAEVTPANIENQTVVLQKDGKETGTVKMPEMVVTATRTETPLEETTKSVSVITAEDMRERQETFLPELMGEQPGVYFRQPESGPMVFLTIREQATGTPLSVQRYAAAGCADTQNTLLISLRICSARAASTVSRS
jgi:outer membrane receptor protein involved in Fe transport